MYHVVLFSNVEKRKKYSYIHTCFIILHIPFPQTLTNCVSGPTTPVGYSDHLLNSFSNCFHVNKMSIHVVLKHWNN